MSAFHPSPDPRYEELQHLRRKAAELEAQLGGPAIPPPPHPSDDYFRHMINSLPALVWMARADGQAMLFNRRWYDLTGVLPEELLGDQYLAIVHPDDRSPGDAVFQRALATQTGFQMEWRARRADGTYVPLLDTATPLFAHDGTFMGLLGCCVDVTERKRMERVLRQHEALLRVALETARMGTWIRDSRTNEQILSIGGQRLLGLPPDSPPITLHDMLVATHPDDRDMLAAIVAEAAETHGSYQVESRIVYPSGEVRWLDLRAQHYFDEQGSATMRIGVGMDITERKQAEAEIRALNQALEAQNRSLEAEVARRTAELEQANQDLAQAARTKDEFLATMSHELRTPLTSVLGVAELLQLESYGPLNERQREALARLEGNGRQLLALINDVLDLAKIEAGKLSIQPERLSAEQLGRTCLDLIRPSAAARNLRLELLATPPGLAVEADEVRLTQIVTNLLSNAVKFTPQGGRVGLEIVEDAAANRVRFTVWDTGIGIAQEDQQRLFQPFVQLDAGLARKYEGTGLGLALVWRLTAMHGGEVSLESTPGAGSRFTVSLPRRAAHASSG